MRKLRLDSRHRPREWKSWDSSQYVLTPDFLYSHLKTSAEASLVAQWLRVRLPMQGTRVRALVRGDPTCRGAAGPVSHGR